MKKGFSLIEILATIVIVAALAAISIPSFTKTKAKSNKRGAETALRVIRLSQKMYYARNGAYACQAPCLNAADIKSALGSEIRDGKYVYSVFAPAPTAFVATADNGTPADTITVDETGQFKLNGVNYDPL